MRRRRSGHMFETNRNGVPIPMRHAPIALAAALMLLPTPSTIRLLAPTVTVPALPDPAVLELITPPSLIDAAPLTVT